MLENISLILQTQNKMSFQEAQTIAYNALNSISIEYIAGFRYEKCSEKEIFYVQLIRACMLEESTIIIDQAFNFFADEMNIDFILQALDLLNISYKRVLLIDLTNQKHHYKENNYVA